MGRWGRPVVRPSMKDSSVAAVAAAVAADVPVGSAVKGELDRPDQVQAWARLTAVVEVAVAVTARRAIRSRRVLPTPATVQ